MARGKYLKPEDVRDKVITIRVNSHEALKIDKFVNIHKRSKSRVLRSFILRVADSYIK